MSWNNNPENTDADAYFTSSDGINPEEECYCATLRVSGAMLEVCTEQGNQAKVTITLPAVATPELNTGLCGNGDGNKENDALSEDDGRVTVLHCAN